MNNFRKNFISTFNILIKTLNNFIKNNFLKIKIHVLKIRYTVLNYTIDTYLLWFNSITTKKSLPFSHIVFIFLCVKSSNYKLIMYYFVFASIIGYGTDLVLNNKTDRLATAIFIKKFSTPELFQIFGNPGSSAVTKLASSLLGNKVVIATGGAIIGGAFCDHALSHSGVYDAVSYKISTYAGIDSETAISRLPQRTSAIDKILLGNNKP